MQTWVTAQWEIHPDFFSGYGGHLKRWTSKKVILFSYTLLWKLKYSLIFNIFSYVKYLVIWYILVISFNPRLIPTPSPCEISKHGCGCLRSHGLSQAMRILRPTQTSICCYRLCPSPLMALPQELNNVGWQHICFLRISSCQWPALILVLCFVSHCFLDQLSPLWTFFFFLLKVVSSGHSENLILKDGLIKRKT